MGTDDIDRMLDGALGSYSSAEPRPGLEGRVLARVEAEGSRRRLRFPRWVWALPAVCALTLVFLMHREPPPPPVVEHARLAPPPAPVWRPPVPIAKAAEQPERGHRPHAAPKQEQFPAPTPLTQEERAMIALVRRAPEIASQVSEAQQRQFEPIRIDEIRIEPIQTDSVQ